MDGPHFFLVHITHPSSDGWEEREAAVYHTAGRRWDAASSGGGVRELYYYCSSLGVARELRLALSKIGGVSCVAREP